VCEFISWVEKGDKVFFLTYDRIYNTPMGDLIQRKFPGEGELIGHAAIRGYSELENGIDKECTDFSTPKNFPPAIVKALKNGEFKKMMPPSVISVLLTKEALAMYANQEPAYAVWQKAYAVWQKTDTVWQKADKDWHKADAKNSIFWDLFASPENRVEAWR